MLCVALSLLLPEGQAGVTSKLAFKCHPNYHRHHRQISKSTKIPNLQGACQDGTPESAGSRQQVPLREGVISEEGQF